MATTYGAQADFLVVYIREAHAVDSEWPMREEGQPVIEQPLDLHERRAAAEACLGTLTLHPLPAVLDEMDDAVSSAWEAWPDRLVLIDAKGRVAFRGGPGPFGFDADELEAALRRELGLPEGAPAR
jgi:hypothetical protein